MWKNIAQPVGPPITKRRMRIACWIRRAQVVQYSCFSAVTMLAWTCLNVTLYIHCPLVKPQWVKFRNTCVSVFSIRCQQEGNKPTVTTRIIHGYTIKRTGAPILLQILKTNSSSDKTEHIWQKKTANCEGDGRPHECPWPTYSCITDTAPSLNEFTHQEIERPPFLISLHIKRAHSIKDSTFLKRSEQQQDSFVGDIAAIAFVNERGH